MSACKTCGGAMKPLFSGEYCPKECDLPPERRTIKPAATKPVGKRGDCPKCTLPGKVLWTLHQAGVRDTIEYMCKACNWQWTCEGDAPASTIAPVNTATGTYNWHFPAGVLPMPGWTLTWQETRP